MKIIHIIVQNNTYYSARSRWTKQPQYKFRFHLIIIDFNPSLFMHAKMMAGKPTGKRFLGRPRRRREDNIRMDLKEIGINTSMYYFAL